MADKKISALTPDASLSGADYVPINEAAGPTTKRTLLSTLAAWFFDQINIPDGSGSPRTRQTETMFDYVASGMVWSGDAYASTRNASMTSGIVYINGRRISISAVTARTFTASRDTYIDILDNTDGTGSLVYTEVTNNNASPSLASNSIRIGIIVTGASNIAAVGSVNQGQPEKILPIATSIAYAVTDSLGNRICNRNPMNTLIGYKQILAGVSHANTTTTDATGLAVPVIVPTGRLVKITIGAQQQRSTQAAGNTNFHQIRESTTVLTEKRWSQPVAAYGEAAFAEHTFAPTAGLHTYKFSYHQQAAGTSSLDAAADTPAYIKVELV